MSRSLEGSSKMRTFGFCMSTRISRSRLRSPPLSLLTKPNCFSGGKRNNVRSCAAVSVSPFAMVTYSARSEEHTSELQSRENLVCRLLLEKKKKKKTKNKQTNTLKKREKSTYII